MPEVRVTDNEESCGVNLCEACRFIRRDVIASASGGREGCCEEYRWREEYGFV